MNSYIDTNKLQFKKAVTKELIKYMQQICDVIGNDIAEEQKEIEVAKKTIRTLKPLVGSGCWACKGIKAKHLHLALVQASKDKKNQTKTIKETALAEFMVNITELHRLNLAIDEAIQNTYTKANQPPEK